MVPILLKWGNIDVFNLQGQDRTNAIFNKLWRFTSKLGGDVDSMKLPKLRHINKDKGEFSCNAFGYCLLKCLIAYKYQQLDGGECDDDEKLV